MTVQDLRFERITNPKEIRATHAQNSATWKGPLTLESYVERERILGEASIARKNQLTEVREEFPELAPMLGIRYFALKDGDTIVSSCETLNRLGYFISPGESRNIEHNLMICVGGVFTPKEYRGKGYASCMVEKLMEYYDAIRDNPNAPRGVKQLSFTLYSEVGEYYKKFGFESRHVPVHTITQIDAFLNKYCERAVFKNDGKVVENADYDALVSLEDQEFRRNLLKLHKADPNAFIFTIKPDADIYRWFNTRDFFILKHIDRPQVPLTLGYVMGDKSHILWHHNWGCESLLIVKLYLNPDASSQEKENILKELFAHAAKETKVTKLKHIEFWDGEIPLEKFADLSKVVHDLEDRSTVYAHNESLSAMRPSPTYNTKNIIWDNNTKLSWF
ncbi:hypothetical protein ZYGR_0I02640 [Zygosaccharomyces rouxii]|uniref:LYC1 C-terminal domain-containing protein n=1 Tax=Zygosaccharomyces rouxii TaxID=4956 RepID=A0A1Q2ZXB6_ZYGRO|nr:hypothetical protein ZYGR_0I02640 [Zygosaccharomyces rouxii]